LWGTLTEAERLDNNDDDHHDGGKVTKRHSITRHCLHLQITWRDTHMLELEKRGWMSFIEPAVGSNRC
ncbi:hypothetical protein SK128_022938, partial [Halocaridina rubra]